MNRRSLMVGLASIGIAAGTVLAGCGGGSSTNVTPLPARVELTPACSDPAPIINTVDPRTLKYFVIFRDDRVSYGPQAREKTLQLAAKYGFTPTSIYMAVLNGFAGPLTPEQVAQLRCEPDVKLLSYVTLSGGAANAR
ncbi:MAG: hypothetical protein V4671_32055 [Armatimonadota bacterium]